MNDPAMQPSLDPHQHVGHETTDASPLYVGLFALGLTLMIALVLPLLGWIFWRFEAAAKRADAPQSPLLGELTPPRPVLQNDPAADLTLFRREEEQRLSSYGWIDPDKRIVRIPIERAIEILSERGLTEFDGSLETPANGERAP
jgi:hypothetical protein